MSHAPMIFAIGTSRSFGQQVAGHLGLDLADHEEREFTDGEHKIRAVESVRDRDVYVIHSLYSDDDQTVNDKLIRLLIFCGSLRDAAAARVTAVIPYLAYTRKDKRTQPNDPVTTRYIAQILEAVGVDRVVTLDVHNLAAFVNAFRVQTEHLEARKLFVEHFVGTLEPGAHILVASPDAGGLKRARYFSDDLAKALGVDVAVGFMEKTRTLDALSAGRLYGDVDGATVIIIDDMISTGGTLSLAASRAKDGGARRIYAAATHGVFAGDAAAKIGADIIDQILVTDSVPPVRLPDALVRQKISVVSCAPLFSAAISRMHGEIPR